MLLKPSVSAVLACILSTSLYAQNAPVPVVDINSTGSSVASFPTATQQTVPAQQVSQNQTAQLLMMVEQLQEEVRFLRGQVEEQAHRMKKMETDQRDRYRDLDRRIMSITKQMSEASAPAAVLAPAVSNPAQAVESSTAPQVTTPKAPTGETDQDAYKRAFKFVRERAYDDSLKAFAEFIRFYPSSPLVPNALFWTAEVYRAKTNPDNQAAKTAYEQLIAQYPRHSKAADAHYKLGLTYDSLGEKAKARAIMEKAISLYPDQSVARLAKDYLAKNP